MSLTLHDFDMATYLTDDATICAFLTEALEDDEPPIILEAIDAVIRALDGRGRIASGSREQIRRWQIELQNGQNVDWGTLMKLIRALGIRLSVTLPVPDGVAA